MTEEAEQFRFDEHERRKDIVVEGHTFSIAVGDFAALDAATDLAVRLDAVGDPEKLEAGAYRRLLAEITDAVDQVLGEGACELVLTGRRPTLTGMVSLLSFVLREASEGVGESLEATLSDLTATVEEE